MKSKAILINYSTIAATVLLILIWLPSTVLAQDFPEPGDFAKGAKSWADNCARCHNMRDPQDLRDDQWITTVFHMRVRAGLTGQQSRDILTFLQESNNRVKQEQAVYTVSAAASIPAQSGEEIYNQTCVACHGSDGKGMVPGSPDLTASDGPLSQSDEILIQRITEGFKSKGSPMAMPPKGGNTNLTQQDIETVLNYMRENFSH